MNGEFQDRKDIDRLFHDLYRIDGQTVNAVRFDEQTEFIDDEGNLFTIDSILRNVLAKYYDQSDIDLIIQDIETGGIDLTEYVKKEDLIDNTKYDIDLDLSVGLSGLDDTITIDMDIVDHIVNKRIDIGGNNDGD